MKAEELMRFDWVRLEDEKIPRQVDWIRSGEVGLFWNKTVTPPYLEPIPLTSEILEKNGFKQYIPENHLETVYACQDVSKAVANELYALWPYQDCSFYLLLRVDGKDMVRMNVHYVHQLQHALRLCGIEKEIIL